MEMETLHIEHLKYSLLTKRRFLPLFLATFLGSFNDNLLRSGLVVLIAYSATQGIELPTRPEILVTICSALLILPLMLFSSLAGPLADKYEKSRLVVLAKLAEVAIMAGAFYGFATHAIYLLMALLFISGTHTAFYGPIKYSLLPEHLRENELMAANGFMASGGFLAVLFGMITGGWLVVMSENYIGFLLLAVASCGLLASLFIPRSKRAHPELHFDLNIFKSMRAMMIYVFSIDRTVLRAIFALSWFLLVGSVYLAQFPNYAQAVVHGNNEVYILFLTTFSVGLAIGSITCDTLLKGRISTHLIPWAALGISIFTYLMVFATPTATHEMLITAREFLQVPEHWLLLTFMLLVSVCGGLYMVPLYTVMQSRSHEQYRSRIMAASGFFDSIFMTVAAIISALLLMAGLDILHLFLIVATANLGMFFYARRLDS